ncbi:MAG TPA: indolepyruvate oxidoreductase subunit beta [bacterium]|nr:indolepyruvate oxidoreductase subunit beta [bacterium]HOL47606.1 indolepyruvate oxidoreductase subunit beta [bacterium]HPQ19406.1 indolepyruvate oxidoreductase subunit beta [bacterium]
MSLTKIIICGVGGQGIILSSKILSEVALESGYDVKQSEVHGMAQRGGSVISHIIYGEKVYSPIISENEADILLGFEKLETARYINFLKKDGFVICNDLKLKPVNIQKYPDEEINQLLNKKNILFINALKYCEELGSTKVMNIFLLGVLSNYLNLADDNYIKLIEKNVKEEFRKININAFIYGRKVGIKNDME